MTLTDLVVLVVLVTVFAVLLFPGCRGDKGPSAAQMIEYRVHCRNNIRQIGLAMQQYAVDHDDSFPPLVDAAGNEVPGVSYDDGSINTADRARTAFAVLLNKAYLTTTRVFICPSTLDLAAGPDDDFPSDFRDADLKDLIFEEDQCSYGWDPTKRRSARGNCALIADKPSEDVSKDGEGTADNNSDNHHKAGQNVWYNDGHVAWAETSAPGSGDDPDIYLGDAGYETSSTDAKIIR